MPRRVAVRSEARPEARRVRVTTGVSDSRRRIVPAEVSSRQLLASLLNEDFC